MLAALAVSTAFALISGSPRALLARDGLVTAAWAGYMYLSLLASRPATFTISRPLLEGRRVWDSATRSWVRPVGLSWDELWVRSPRFRRIWRTCTVIWGTAILADAVARLLMALALPVGVVPALAGALWPVTFVILQVVTNVYFARAGFWRLLITGPGQDRPDGYTAPVPAGGACLVLTASSREAGLVAQRGTGPDAGPSQAPAADTDGRYERDELRAVAVPAGTQDPADRAAAPARGQVDLGAQPAAGAAQGLPARPAGSCHSLLPPVLLCRLLPLGYEHRDARLSSLQRSGAPR